MKNKKIRQVKMRMGRRIIIIFFFHMSFNKTDEEEKTHQKLKIYACN